MNPYAPPLVIESAETTRTEFIRKTYAHLAGAVGLFALICTIIMSTALKTIIAVTLLKAWIVTLLLFMVVGWVANKWAMSETSKGKQYAGLILYTVFEAILFTPLLYFAQIKAGGNGIIAQAAFATIGLVVGLSVIALTTKKDFSFLNGFLKIGMFVALGLVVSSIIFGFNLGTWFSAAMILFAGASLLRNTSNLLHAYNPNQYVAASLALFADVALMFWYVLRLLMQLASDD